VALEAAHIARDVGALEADRPGIGGEKSVEHPERRRLAGPVRAQQPEHLPGLTDQIDAVDHQSTAEMFDERARFEQCGHPGHWTGR
jgi:hypothetical protein